MTSPATVMPAQAGIQFIFEGFAYNLEKGQTVNWHLHTLK
jgi:hypothetical protein